MINVTLEQFLTFGQLGPLSVGLTNIDVRAAIGDPDAEGGLSRNQNKPRIWKYGDIELHFAPDAEGVLRIWAIMITDFGGAPTGGPALRLDPWFIRAGLEAADARAALDAAGQSFVNARLEADKNQEVIVVAGCTSLHFLNEPVDGHPQGLFCLTSPAIQTVQELSP